MRVFVELVAPYAVVYGHKTGRLWFLNGPQCGDVPPVGESAGNEAGGWSGGKLVVGEPFAEP